MTPLKLRAGDAETLAAEYLDIISSFETGYCPVQFDSSSVSGLQEENILAVHFANRGAQGSPGTVDILYHSEDGVKVLSGNYYYRHSFCRVDLDALLPKLPMLKWLDDRFSNDPPFPIRGMLKVPDGWQYVYMGALNHLFVRDEIIDIDKTRTLLDLLRKEMGGAGAAFDAIAWLCGAD